MITKPHIFTVARLNQESRHLLEEGLGTVWVEAEISNLVFPASGHWYFSLKDERAQIRCAMFKGNNSKIKFTPEDGDQVLVKGRVSLYEPRGDYQLIVEQLEPSGVGALQKAFEQLKTKLAAEGLFNNTHKKPLPALPRCVGVVTSSSGAAVHDILTVLKRRFPALPIIIYPCSVQGETASAEIVAAIQIANRRQECDVLIVGRGGGSLEDLWCFNTEAVARAIYASEIPIVSAVGHEVDVTIADFVADQRAATPSAAAELISPNVSDWLQSIEQMQQRLIHAMQLYLARLTTQLKFLRNTLRHPKYKLQEQAQKLDYLSTHLRNAMQNYLHKQQQTFAVLISKLQAFSPLATLERGYAIVQQAGKIVTRVEQVKPGDHLQIKVTDGEIYCTASRFES